MKRILTGMIFVIILMLPMICSAAWVIHLKDGRRFTTPDYREEGDQIKFERYGGLIGIPKDQVIQIEETEGSPEKMPLEEDRPALKAEGSKDDQKGKITSENSENKKEEKKDSEKNDLAYYKKKKLSLQTQLNDALEKYKTARQLGNEAEFQKQYGIATKLAAELEQLKKEVKRKNYGFLPLWWDS